MTAQAVDWVGIYGALHRWVWRSTGIPADRVRALVNRDLGEAKGPGPKATIDLLSLVETSQPGKSVRPQIMKQRYTVLVDGPGEVGVDFFAGRSLTPLRISVVADAEDGPEDIAAALLVELTAALPVGYTAIADPGDAASVLVTGSTEAPMFAARAVNASISAATPIPRFPYVHRVQHRAIWRITFRSDTVAAAPTQAAVAAGPRFAADFMTRAQVYRRSLLDSAMLRFGFRPNGTPSTQPNVPSNRRESTAALDVAFLGLLTGAEAAFALRTAGFSASAA